MRPFLPGTQVPGSFHRAVSPPKFSLNSHPPQTIILHILSHILRGECPHFILSLQKTNLAAWRNLKKKQTPMKYFFWREQTPDCYFGCEWHFKKKLRNLIFKRENVSPNLINSPMLGIPQKEDNVNWKGKASKVWWTLLEMREETGRYDNLLNRYCS